MSRLLLITLLLCTGCTPILKLAYGIKKPSIERSPEDLTKYLERKGLRTDNVLVYPEEDYVHAFEQLSGVPEVRIFDREGRLVPYGEPGSCNASAFSFIEQLDPAATYPTESLRVEEAMAGLTALGGGRPSLSPDADFHVVLYWARWAGRLNVDHVKVWEEQAAQNPLAELQVLKVSLDRVPDSE